MEHQAITVKYKDLEAEIDLKIADLILNLWKLDITTLLSCENNVPENYVWILFASAGDAEAFIAALDLQHNYEPDSLYQRVHSNSDDENSWEYAALVDDLNLSYQEINENEVEEISSGPAFSIFNISVRFPDTDLPEVERLILLAVDKIEVPD